MTIRVAAIEVSHWHALYDAAYLRHLMAMPDVELVAIQDSDGGLVARRAAELGSPPTYTDYRKMLATTRPNFVVALGRHCQMAQIAHELLDLGYPFLMETKEHFNYVLNRNLISAFLIMRYGAPLMHPNGGSIVCISTTTVTQQATGLAALVRLARLGPVGLAGREHRRCDERGGQHRKQTRAHRETPGADNDQLRAAAGRDR